MSAGTSRSSAASSRHCPNRCGIGPRLSQVRAWVEHPFHIVKNPGAAPGQALFRHKKQRYRGLAKNTAQLHTLFALATLVIVTKALLAQGRV